MRGMNSKRKRKRMDTLKNIFLIVALVLCLAGGLTQCAKWQAETDKKRLNLVQWCTMWRLAKCGKPADIKQRGKK